MQRTSALLLVYVLPALVLLGLLLAALGIMLPWYAYLFGVPAVLLCLILGVGSVALAQEERAGRTSSVVEQWLRWLRDLAAPAPSTVPVPIPVAVRTVLRGLRGTLLYREPAPLALGADPHAFTAPPPGVPIIRPDYAGGRLVIRQLKGSAPVGAIDLYVLRLRDGRYDLVAGPSRLQLTETTPPQGEPYWETNIPLRPLVGEFRPGDDFIFCVAVPPAASPSA